MSAPDFDRALVMPTFLAETDEGLHAMEESLVRLESAPADDETLNVIFRAVHTLKGNAAALGLAAPADFSHGLEDLLDRLRGGVLTATPDLISLLLECVDTLRVMVPESVAGRDTLRAANHKLLARLSASAEGQALGLRSEPAAAAEALGTVAARTLRVDVSKLDRMLNLSGEISIARGRLSALIETRKASPAREAALDALRELNELFVDLQQEITGIRMVPVGPTFRPFLRTVRDAAAVYAKQARLVLEGEEVEVDTSVIELIRDPLTHLIRNALDHGIEPPETRRALGKPALGHITLRARHDAGRIVIQLSDDGAGLNRERIVARARTLGWISDAARMSDADVYRLVFEPGFTTADAVTALSGRGIGMDVVRRNVEALRGTVDVESRAGVGATVTIRLPLTLAIIRGFLVGVADETFVIPLDTVSECIDHGPGDDARDEHSGIVQLRGEAVPFLRLRRAFELGGRPAGGRESIVVLRHGERRAGLAVDSLLGECEAVIKPLGALLTNLPGISSATILASGRVALILEPAVLLESAEARARAGVERVRGTS